MTGWAAAELRLVSAGVAAVAVAFGLARYGYGLLLPDIRADLGLGTAVLGLIGSGAYVAYLLATVLGSGLAARRGGRVAVLLGTGLAIGGMLLVAVARGPLLLAGGVFLAGAAAALVFPPFSDLVALRVAPARRARGLAAISSGTGWGVVASVPVALLVQGDWRVAWVVYAVLAALVLAWARAVLPTATGVAPERARVRLAWFLCPRSGPLLAGALLVGLGASVFWTFAVDHVAVAGGVDPAAARLLVVLVGLAGLAGTLGAVLLERVGSRVGLALSVLSLAAALLLLGLAPGHWPAVAVAALLFGAAYNLAVAIHVIWSARVFAERPSTGLAALVFCNGAGLLAGPALGGLLAEGAGLVVAFVAAAATVATTALLLPREDLLAPGADAPARA